MATIRLKFRHSSVPDKEGVLVYQVIHHRTARLVSSGYQIFPDEWNEKTSMPISAGAGDRREPLRLIRDKINWEMRQFQNIINDMEQQGQAYTAADIVNAFAERPAAESVFSFVHSQIIKLIQQQKIRAAEIFRSTLNSFAAYRCQQDLSFEAIDADLIERYEAYLKDKGLMRNSTSFYMRNLRRVYNQAVDSALTIDKKPFRHVYTGIDKTVKRAIPMKYIKRIKELDLSLEPDLDFARDIFLFSFYTRGMSFIDIAFLKKTDLKNGFVTYFRKKTGQRLSYRWETQMEDIVKKHENKNGRYMLPIILHEGQDERKQYHYKLKQTDRLLKKIAERADIAIPLTLYVARHSWASIAKEKRIPTSVISEGMGHDSEATTRIYLMTLDTAVVDRANRKIIRDL